MLDDSVRERLISSAFKLFGSRGYPNTTIDDIAEHAGLSRTTFFRYFKTKESVIFPGHERLLEDVANRLASARADGAALPAVIDAARLVLLNYVGEGERARQRYALGKAVQALREREILGGAEYQRLFREFLSSRTDADPPLSSIRRAEMLAALVVAVNNHVIRRWLRGEAVDPDREFDEAMNDVITSASALSGDGSPEEDSTSVLVFRTGVPRRQIIAALKGMQDP